MAINLNDESLDGTENTFFNNGKAGLGDNIAYIGIFQKEEKDPANAPDFKIRFESSNGGIESLAFYYKDPTRESYEKDLKKQMALLRHLAHQMVDPNYTFPPFEDARAMLDGVLLYIKEKTPARKLFRIACNFGTNQGHKAFVKIRTWAPLLEPMTVPMSESNKRLQPGDIEMMERLQSDANSGSSATNPSASAPAPAAKWGQPTT